MQLCRNSLGVARKSAQHMAHNCYYSAFIPLTDWPGKSIVRHKYIYIYARPYLSHQTPGTPKFRHLQSPPRPGAPPAVPGLRLFRSARPAPAQIRESASRTKQGVFARAGRQRVWVVPAHTLPGAGALCGPGFGGTAAGQARPAPGAQADRPGAPVLGAGASRPPGAQRPATGHTSAPALPHQGASAHVGESLEGQGKKGAPEITANSPAAGAVSW